MRRYKKPFTDEVKILEAINAFLPAVGHHSFSFRWPEEGNGGSGSYYHIGRMNVPQAVMKDVCAKNGIVLAEHWRSSFGRGKWNIFDHCWIKSRFGETKVERSLTGGVRNCDNAEARAYYDAQHARSVAAISGAIDTDGLEAAIAIKKALKASGEYL